MDKTIPYSVFDYESYCEEIKRQIQNKNTHFFIDTNVLFTLIFYKDELTDSLLNWFKINKERVHIPHWVYNEYTKHSLSPSEVQKVSPVPKFAYANLVNDFANVYDYIDDKKLNQSAFANAGDFLKKLDNSIKIIKQAQKILVKDYNAQKVTDFFMRDMVLDFELDMATITKEFQIRLENKIPPGFGEYKKENIIGDFIIWKEILNYKTGDKFCPSIFISDDQKADWMYCPDKQNKVQTSYLQKKVEKIADPRLCREHKKNRGTDEFYAINLKSFIAALYEIDPITYPSLLPHISQDTALMVASTDNQSPESTCKRNEDFGYSSHTTKDSEYKVFVNSDIGIAVCKLKTYTFGTQAEGIKHFKQHMNEIAQQYSSNSNDLKNDLFILGRNIYQAACGGEWESQAFMENLRSNIAAFNQPRQGNPLLEGMLFESYFNKYGEFRLRRKADYLPQVVTIVLLNEVEKNYAREILTPFSEYLPFIPGDSHVTFSVQGNESEGTFVVDKILYQDQIIFDTKAPVEDDGEYFPIYMIHSSIGSRFIRTLKDVLQKNFEIPLDMIIFNVSDDKTFKINGTLYLQNISLKGITKLIRNF